MGDRVGTIIRRTVGPAVLVAALVAPGAALGDGLDLDHSVPFTPVAPPVKEAMSGGEGATWEFLSTFTTGNPQTDLDFFTQGGNTFASFGTLGAGPNAGGQTILQLTEGGQIKPNLVASHPSASCISSPGSATGLQHDVEATPKGNVVFNADVTAAARDDTQLLLDATDAAGRCHDQGTLGLAGAPRGGLEIIDVTDPAKPAVIGLTSHIGQAHTVNVDPKRPQIAYVLSSDNVGVDGEGKRSNENPNTNPGPGGGGEPFDLDGFEVVDLSSCMNFPPGTTVQQKRDACRPQVFRYRYPSIAIAQGHTNKTGSNGVFGCHESEIYPDDRLTCGSGNAAIVFDLKGSFDDRGTPADFRDDTLRGDPLPCQVRNSSSVGMFFTGAKVTDCVAKDFGTAMADGTFLAIPNWIKLGSPSLADVKYVGSAFHQGREQNQDEATTDFTSDEDIDFNHETELTASGKYLIATDERGGGILPPGASCSPGEDLKVGNGGLHAYAVDRLLTRAPTSAEDAFTSYARNSQGGKSIFRVPIRTKAQASLCTAHVFQQIPGQNRIFMGWYSQGTQVIDYTENPDGTLDFRNAGFFIPTNADEWVSHVFKVERNADGTFTYFGAASDFAVGDAGRNSVEVYKVTLPPPPAPAGRLAGTGAGFAPVVPTIPPKATRGLSCIPPKMKLTRLGLGPFRTGATRQATLDRTNLRARQARGQSLRYCVQGGGRIDVGIRKGRVVFISSTAPSRRGRNGIGRGSSLRDVQRNYGKLRKVAPGLFAAGAAKKVAFGIRAKRVRYVAVLDQSIIRNRGALRQQIKLAGL